MLVSELNRDQLTELKQYYYCQNNDSVSYYELATIDDLVSDEEIHNEFSHVVFTDEDFACSSSVSLHSDYTVEVEE